MGSPQPWATGIYDQAFAEMLRSQQLTKRKLDSLLAQAARDSEREMLRLSRRGGVGSSVRQSQLAFSLHSLREVQASLWSDVGEATRLGIARGAEAAAAAHRQILSVLTHPMSAGAGYASDLAESMRYASQKSLDGLRGRLVNNIELSSRVYRNQALANDRVGRVVNSGLLRNASAREIATDVKGLIRPDTPGGVSYAANRLGRTEINNAYHTVSREGYQKQPWVEGAKWQLSGRHGRPDSCDDLARADDYGLGEGVYPPLHLPNLPHPNCLCHTVAVTPTPDQFVNSLLSGHHDNWLAQHGLEPMQPGSISVARSTRESLGEAVKGARVLEAAAPERRQIIESMLRSGADDREILKVLKPPGGAARRKYLEEIESARSGAAPPVPGPRMRPQPEPVKPTPAPKPPAPKSAAAVPDTDGFAQRVLSGEVELPAPTTITDRVALRSGHERNLSTFSDPVLRGEVRVGMQMLQARYPEAMRKLLSVTENTKGFSGDRVAAHYRPDFRAIEFQKGPGVAEHLGMSRRLNVSGWWAADAESGVRGVLFHEFGHHADALLTAQQRRAMFDEVEELLQTRGIKHGQEKLSATELVQDHAGAVRGMLSEYGTTNTQEFIAEAFAEFMTETEPEGMRSIARIVGKHIDAALADRSLAARVADAADSKPGVGPSKKLGRTVEEAPPAPAAPAKPAADVESIKAEKLARREELNEILDRTRQGRGLTQTQMDDRARLIQEIADLDRQKYEARNGRIPQTRGRALDDGDPPTTRLVGEADRKVRDTYVANDELTLKNNAMLRLGQTPRSWANSMDEYTRSSELTTDGVLHRAAVLPTRVVDEIARSGVLKEKGFLSVSPNRSVADLYRKARALDRATNGRGGQHVMFEIRVPKGTKVGVMDSTEWVLPRGSSFSVESVELGADGVWRVVMEIA